MAPTLYRIRKLRFEFVELALNDRLLVETTEDLH